MNCSQHEGLAMLIVVLLIVILGGCSHASNNGGGKEGSDDVESLTELTELTEPKAGERVSLDVPTEFSVGVLPLGVKMPISIPVINRTESTARIVFSAADCGCVSEVDNLVLAPGDNGELVLLLNATKEGSIRRKVIYEVSGLRGVQNIPISLVGECKDRLVSPNSVSLGAVRPGDSHEGVFEVAGKEQSGWKYSSIKQVAGPTVGVVLTGSADPGKLRVSVKIPPTSSNGLRWLYELEFVEVGGTRVCTAPVSLMCSVSNELFEDNALYLGIIAPSSQRVIERRFKLRKRDLDLGKLVFEGGSGASLSISRPQEESDEAIVRLEIDRGAAVGMHQAILKLGSDSSFADLGAIEIPVTWMVLP